MRYFTFIFIAYLLLLSWQQCQDLAVNNASFALDKTEHAPTPAAPSDETDDCSPFCICSCCHIFTISNLPTFTVKNNYTVLTVRVPKTYYENNYSQQPLTSIWQPPKFYFTA